MVDWVLVNHNEKEYGITAPRPGHTTMQGLACILAVAAAIAVGRAAPGTIPVGYTVATPSGFKHMADGAVFCCLKFCWHIEPTVRTQARTEEHCTRWMCKECTRMMLLRTW
jgi:hypothetical protein